ncbi:transposase, ORF A, IS3 family, IS407 group [Escherichia coli]|nr:transposase, ORF A, IS3 family, IS407 group [Escherichia coli]
MKKRFSDEQIISILREAEAGVPARELCRKQGSVPAEGEMTP